MIICNGSPRGKQSNTQVLLEAFMDGLRSEGFTDMMVYHLSRPSERRKAAAQFPGAGKFLLAFPLYTDSMPGIVKEFMEMLAPWKGREENPDMGFLVQSGFPEPAHSRYVERYLRKLTHRLHSRYLGTIVRGGVEGIRVMPGWMTRKLRRRMMLLGKNFAVNGVFDRRLIHRLAPRERMSKRQIRLFRWMQNTSMANYYWNKQLRENDAYALRDERPYA